MDIHITLLCTTPNHCTCIVGHFAILHYTLVLYQFKVIGCIYCSIIAYNSYHAQEKAIAY